MKWISTSEAAKLLGVHISRVYILMREGRLPSQKIGNSYVINENDLKLIGERKSGRPTKEAVAARQLPGAEAAILRQFAETEHGYIFTEVPIGGPGEKNRWQGKGAWPYIDGVLLRTGHGQAEICPYTRYRADFERHLPESEVTLIEVKVNLNRGVIGQVIAGKDMFESQYKSKVSNMLLLCPNGRIDPALEWVCNERSIEVKSIPVNLKRSRLPPNRLNDEKLEMLGQYSKKNPGFIFTQVPIGGPLRGPHWGAGGGWDYIDAVRIPTGKNDAGIFNFETNSDQFFRHVEDAEVELIEIPGPASHTGVRKLNRGAIGKILSAKDLFGEQYGKNVKGLIIVCSKSDPALEWVCEKEGVSIYKIG